jgi:hypothetical protein
VAGIVVGEDKLFEVSDVFSKKIRTTKSYWRKIKEEKHKDLVSGIEEIIETIVKPDEVYQSIKDETVSIQFRKYSDFTLIVVTKHLNGDGFLVTAYQTTKPKMKGKKLWPK